MKHFAAILLGVAWVGACSDSPPPQTNGSPAAQQRPPEPRTTVARDAVVRLERELGPVAAPSGGDADLPEHVTGLVESIPSMTGGLAQAALQELFDLAPASLPHLARWLDDPEKPAAERRVAVEALGASDSRYAAELLLARIEVMRTRKNDEAWIRAHCAWRLGQGTQDWSVPRLIRHLRYETDHETVIWIARALAKFENLSGLDALFVVRTSGATSELRESANVALYELARTRGFDDPESLARAWFAADPRLASPALSPARQLEIWRVIAGFAEWQLRGVDDGRFTLARENSAAAELLEQALADSDRYVRTHAAQALERMGARGASAADALLSLLDDREAGIFAAEALGGIGAKQAEPALMSRLEPQHSLEMRTAAARGLAALSLPSSVAALRKFTTEDAPRDLRFATTCALLRCAPAEASNAQVLFILDDYATESGETATSEPALRAWLAAQAPKRIADWDRAQSAGAIARIALRAALAREALASSAK